MVELRNLADTGNPKSVSNRFRKKRFLLFLEFIKNQQKPVKILDAGGTQNFWEQMNFTSPSEVNITILNREHINITLPNFRFIQGDIRNMNSFGSGEFDTVFSNSVIEHTGTFEDRKAAANEIVRAGKKYFVQTPNFYFPVEPHFLFPFYQHLPQKAKIFLLMNFRLGWFEKQKNRTDAEKIINSIKLLTKSELQILFPGSCLIKEKFLFLTKSYIVHN